VKTTWETALVHPEVLGLPHAVLKAANLPDIRFHEMRHTHATILLMKGIPAKVVSERLGHSSIVTTLTVYAHFLPSMQQDAARTLNALLK
jgi:integrase